VDTDAVISFENVTLGYDRHPAVHHLSGPVRRGAGMAIIGPNGAGKSTLLKGIVGLLRPLEGRISVAPVVRGRVAYLPQASAIDRSFPIDVTGFVRLGLWREIGLLGRMTRARACRVQAAIEQVGLAGYERRSLDMLSGGQLQRALFARLVVAQPQVLLLDEPFSAIDARTARELASLFDEWHREERTIIAVLHDLEQVRAHFPETLLLAREPIAWGPTATVVTEAQLSEAHAHLIRFDEAAPWCDAPVDVQPPAPALDTEESSAGAARSEGKRPAAESGTAPRSRGEAA